MATRNGVIKKVPLDKFAWLRSNGLIATNLKPEDELVAVELVSDEDEAILVSKKGRSVRFPVKPLRVASRTSGGVRGIRLDSGDNVVSMGLIVPSSYLLTVTSNGFGKLCPISGYRSQSRGGSGLRAHRVTTKTGVVVDAKLVFPSQELMLISREGIVIKTSVEEISIQSRNTQGVHVMKLDKGDKVAAIACLRR